MKARDSDYPICRHTKTNGLLCQSPAAGISAYCYFHKKLLRTRMSSTAPTLTEHPLYSLRNAQSIQQALSMVFAGLTSNRIRPAQAGKMLFALQTAASQLPQNPSESGI